MSTIRVLSPYQASSLIVYIQIIFTILKYPQERTHLISSHFLTYRQQSPDNAGFVLCCPSLTRIPCYPTGMGMSDTGKPFLPQLDTAHSSFITLLWDYSILWSLYPLLHDFLAFGYFRANLCVSKGRQWIIKFKWIYLVTN